jgi:CRP-like cAMP-binding protein
VPLPIPIEGELIYNLAAGLGLIAYLLTSVLWLRIVLVIGACFYIATGVVLGLNSMIAWHIAYALVNLAHVVLLIRDQSDRSLPPEIRDLYHSRFIGLKPREFERLLKINEEVTTSSSKLLTEGEANDRLFLVTSGEIVVHKNGNQVDRRGPGDFIGEMSVLTGEPASADVTVPGSARYCYWSLQDLENLRTKNLPLYNRFMMIVGQNVVEKLRQLTHSSFATGGNVAGSV